MTMNVGIFIYNDIEVLDFAGPFEVFSTASRVAARMDDRAAEAFKVFTISETVAPVTARGGLQVTAAYTLRNHPDIDLLLIPGGIVTRELEKEHLIAWIRATAEGTQITASVCTGAFLLAKADLLHSKAATTHWEDIPDLESMFPDIDIRRDARWVDQGRVVTAAGISAGIDMSLHLVARTHNPDLARCTARQMEYDWNKGA